MGLEILQFHSQSSPPSHPPSYLPFRPRLPSATQPACPGGAARARARTRTPWATPDSLSLSPRLQARGGAALAADNPSLLKDTSSSTPMGRVRARGSRTLLPGPSLRAEGWPGAESTPPLRQPRPPSLRRPPRPAPPGQAQRPCDPPRPGRDATGRDALGRTWGSRARPGTGTAWSGGGSSCCSTCCACWSVRDAGAWGCGNPFPGGRRHRTPRRCVWRVRAAATRPSRLPGGGGARGAPRRRGPASARLPRASSQASVSPAVPAQEGASMPCLRQQEVAADGSLAPPSCALAPCPAGTVIHAGGGPVGARRGWGRGRGHKRGSPTSARGRHPDGLREGWARARDSS